MECIAQSPGITALELADYVHVDKATITKKVRYKLEEPYLKRKNATNESVHLNCQVRKVDNYDTDSCGGGR